MKRFTRPLLAVIALGLVFTQPMSAADAIERDVAGGRWYSQTARPGELGFALRDDETARFWSEFQRLGGVPVLGYPISERFELDGFVVQATQRVILQWHPDRGEAMAVNVLDRLHDSGSDDWLRTVRQTPPPDRFTEGGKSWSAIVRERQSILDDHPTIRAMYFAGPGDPLAMHGLPTSRAVDVGNHVALRTQRAVFQLWKEDVPWAKAGEVTLALGGSIALEAGLIPRTVTRGGPADVAPVPPGPVVAWPIAIDPGELNLTGGDLGLGARLIDDRAIGATPGTRLSRNGFAAGHRRGYVVEVAGGTRTRDTIVMGQIDLFRDIEGTRAFWEADALRQWIADEPAARADRVTIAQIGDESVGFRIVSGDIAARGYLVMARRANAIVAVSMLSQEAWPTLGETARLASILERRVRGAAR
ncbi:MAG: hypothetical protein EPO26_05030 [Chloroflexota bacterium]|nr:MAG: hypothetical protein EPO26_05030 [Chloroflexota bacterium]